MNIKDFIPIIKHFHSAGYWFAFFAAIAETFPAIGLLVPGSSIIVILGGLAAEKYFDVGDLIFFVVLGAIIGDNINYFLGRKFRSKLIKKKNFFIKPSLVEKSKAFFAKHGGRSVFIGRFIPSLRETLPMVAGLSQMDKKQFLLWNFLGAILWGSGLCLAGYSFNNYFSISKLVLTRSGIFILTIIISIVIFNFLKKMVVKSKFKIWRVIKSILRSIYGALAENEYIKPFTEKHKKIFTFLKKRVDKKHFFGLPFTLFSIGIIYILALMGGVVENVLSSEIITFADVRIENLLAYFRHEFYINLFLWITLLGKIQVVLVLIVTTLFMLWLWNKKTYILPFLAGISGSLIFTNLSKIIFHRPRPSVAFYTETTYSFPSGHSTIVVMLYGFMAYILIKNTTNWKLKVNTAFTAIIIILLVGFSRLYLGVHYVSDVWGGYLVGLLWLTISIAYTEYLHFSTKEKFSPHKNKILLSSAALIFSLSSYLAIGFNYSPKKVAAEAKSYVTATDVFSIFGDEKSKFTESILGINQEPVSFIISAADDNELISLFEKGGWYLADEISGLSLLKSAKAIFMNVPYPQAPMTPDFWIASINNFGFEKPTEINSVKNRHHSRFWKTDFVTQEGKHIYIGTTSLDESLKWGITHKINPDIDTERSILLNDILSTDMVKKYEIRQFVNPELGKNFLGDMFFTDGKAAVISLK